jgi:hypothetical protein
VTRKTHPLSTSPTFTPPYLTRARIKYPRIPEEPDADAINVAQYAELVLRAAATVLYPWGIQREWLDIWVLQDWYQAHLYLPG